MNLRYEELTNECEKNWTTGGPNSGGVSGYFLYGEFMYPWSVEWGEKPGVDPGISIPDFYEMYKDLQDSRYQEIIQYLDQRLRRL